jgi:hypothetical protein
MAIKQRSADLAREDRRAGARERQQLPDRAPPAHVLACKLENLDHPTKAGVGFCF